MKRIATLFIVFIAAALTQQLQAQTFISQHSANGDSASANGPGIFNVYNELKSTSSPVTVEWQVVDHATNLTAAGTPWGVDGLCDNVTCYAGGAPLLSGLPQISDPYVSTFFGTFYTILNATNAPTGSMTWLRVSVRDTSTGGTSRSLVFIGTKSATGVVSTSTSEEAVLLFPNPATERLTVALTDGRSMAGMTVLGFDGRILLRQAVSGNTASVTLDKLPPGLYFLSLHDVVGAPLATRRFVRQ